MIKIKRKKSNIIKSNNEIDVILKKIVLENSLSDINNVNKIIKNIKKQKEWETMIYLLFFKACEYSKNKKVLSKIFSQIKKFNINILNNFRQTPLEVALGELHKIAVEFLIENDADIELNILDKKINLIISFLRNQKLYIDHNTKNNNDKNKRINEIINILKVFVKNYYYLNIYEEYRDTTALLYAIMLRNKKLVQFLIEEGGADVNLGNSNNVTPILYCGQHGDFNTFKYLVKTEKSFDITSTNDTNRKNILHYILKNESIEDAYKMIEFLITNRKNTFSNKINDKNKNGETPIYNILNWDNFTNNHKKLLSILINNGLDISIDENAFIKALDAKIEELKKEINNDKLNLEEQFFDKNDKIEIEISIEEKNKKINALTSIKKFLVKN